MEASPNHFSPLYGVLVKEADERALAIKTIKNALNQVFSDLSYRSYNAENPKEEMKFLQDLASPSLLPLNELIQLTACESCSKDFPLQLEKALKRISNKTFVIISGDILTKTSHLHKTLEKLGVICELGEIKPWEKEKSLDEWITLQASLEKKSIEPEAIKILVKGTQGNFAIATSEWEKLVSYVGNRNTIKKFDVLEICHLSITDSSWHFAESVMSFQIKEALEAGCRSLMQGTSFIALLRQLRHQAILTLEALSHDHSGSLNQLVEKYPYLRGALLEKLLIKARNWKDKKLSSFITKIDRAEFKAKDGVQNSELLLTILLGEIS